MICDDHQIVRDGLSQILSLYPDINVMEKIANGEALIKALKNKQPEVLILDISLPGRSGLEVLKQVKMIYPDISVLILTMYPQDQYAIRMIKAGASSYLNKDIAPDILVDAIRTISSGNDYINNEVANLLVGEMIRVNKGLPYNELSDREYEVLLLIGQGISLTAISNKLCLSVKTISTYRTRLMSKLEINSNTDLVKYMIRNGIIAAE
jgi:two-component system invasion response regulator UvrY